MHEDFNETDVEESVSVDATHLCAISMSLGRHIQWDLLSPDDSSGSLWSTHQQLARFAQVAAQTFSEMLNLGNKVTIDQFMSHVIEPFGTILCQQLVMGTYSYAECLIQLGKNIYSFYDSIEECTDEELSAINRHTTFSMTTHYQHQLARSNPLAHVTFH